MFFTPQEKNQERWVGPLGMGGHKEGRREKGGAIGQRRTHFVAVGKGACFHSKKVGKPAMRGLGQTFSSVEEKLAEPAPGDPAGSFSALPALSGGAACKGGMALEGSLGGLRLLANFQVKPPGFSLLGFPKTGPIAPVGGPRFCAMGPPAGGPACGPMGLAMLFPLTPHSLACDGPARRCTSSTTRAARSGVVGWLRPQGVLQQEQQRKISAGPRPHVAPPALERPKLAGEVGSRNAIEALRPSYC